MPTVNTWGVSAVLSVATTSASSATTAATTALSDINTALTTLANGTEFSAPESGGAIAFDEPDGANGAFSVSECQLIIAADSQTDAQTAAAASAAAIATAIASINPAVTVTLEQEEAGAEGGFVLDLLQ